MFNTILADISHYKRYFKSTLPYALFIPKVIYSHPASAGLILFRFGSYAKQAKFFLRQILLLIYYLMLPFVRLYSGVQISLTASIGKGAVLLHYGGIVISHGTKIGDNCLIHHNVNFVGYRNKNGPQVGDNFYAGVGVTAVDHIIIEDNVTAGAGSVISKCVPENAFIAGVPAKIIRYRKENERPSENVTLRAKHHQWLK